MGVSIAICELDTDASACKNAKTSILKVNLKDVTGFESCAEFDMIVSIAAAKTAFGAEFDAFAKRNRVDAEAENIYLDKVKNDADKQKLLPVATKQYTGWIAVDNNSADTKQKLLDLADPDNRLTKWDMLSFDEMGEACKKCEVSWDEGRGCIGTSVRTTPLCRRSPQNTAVRSLLAYQTRSRTRHSSQKRTPLGCWKRSSAQGKAPTREQDDGPALLGVLDRLEKVANISLKYGAKFYFL